MLMGEAGFLMVGKRRYHTVVLPPDLENLDAATMKLLEGFAAQGGGADLLRTAPRAGRRPAVGSRGQIGPGPRLSADEARGRGIAADAGRRL